MSFSETYSVKEMLYHYGFSFMKVSHLTWSKEKSVRVFYARLLPGEGLIVSCESVCPNICCRSEDTGRKVTFST